MRFALIVVVIAACSGKSEEPAPAPKPTVAPVNAPPISIEPKLESVIGTRVDEDGPLTPTLETDVNATTFIGCDLRFANLPQGTEIELVWLFKPVKVTDPARVIHQMWFPNPGHEPKRAYVDRVTGALGSYECLWTAGPRGVSARLVAK